MAAPVVPTRLAITVPTSRSPALAIGVPRRFPVTRMPPATVNSENSSTMKLRYSPSMACSKASSAPAGPATTAMGTRVTTDQAAAILP